MFKKKVNDYDWKVNKEEIKDSFFEENKDYFKFYGRDIENLFAKCKIAHAERVLFLQTRRKKIINKADLDRGFELYKKEGRSSVDENKK